MAATAWMERCLFRATSSGTGNFVDASAITGYQRAAGLLDDGETYTYSAESDDKSQWEFGQGVWTAGTSTLARTSVTYSSTGSKVSFTAAPKVSIVADSDIFYKAKNAFAAIVTAASQAQQEAGSATTNFTTPGLQQYHPSAIKCHGFTTGGGTPVLHANSYNTISIADTNPGQITVNIGNDFSSANWTGVASCTCAAAANRMVSLVTKAAGSVILESSSVAATAADPGTGWNWIFAGDQ